MAGSIHKFETPGGRTRYRARYRDASGKQHEKRFEKKTDARQWLNGRTAAIVSGTHTSPARSRITISEWSETWLAAQPHLKATTRDRYENTLNLHVLPSWGHVRLDQVEHSAVAAWVGKLSTKPAKNRKTPLSASSVRQAHRVLALMLGYAVSDSRLAMNPAARVSLPRPAKPKQNVPSRDQVHALSEAAGQDQDVVQAMAQTGLRFGELAALRVADFDPSIGELHVAASVSEVRGKLVWSDYTKNDKDRWVNVPGFLVPDLTARADGRGPDEPLFEAPEGGVLRLSNWRRRIFDPAMRKAGIGRFTPHDLRHAAASMAISSGASVKSVQEMLGHASAAMTLDVYTGLFRKDRQALAKRMDQAHRDFLASKRKEAS